MPGIGSLVREIDVNISENWETNLLFFLSKIKGHILSVNISKVSIMEEMAQTER